MASGDIKGRELESSESVIMVVNRAGAAADNLKELIEFMDAPNVCTATPAKWRQQIGDSRLEAVFIGPDLSDKDVRALVDDIGKLDPNIPIVMLSEEDEA
jgi:DNA-binding NtrC family response regulator